ncbi:MAG: hypothetical protein QGH74_10085 [Candidatus Brocadiia bacterium]|nr:hypothetical protein [Candidatus Brocadiia bacterium]
MRHSRCLMILAAMAGLVGGCCLPSPTVATTASTAQTLTGTAGQYYIPRLHRRVAQWRRELPALRETARAGANGVLAGGNLYIAGPQHSFVIEGFVRSGGLILMKKYAPKVELTGRDTVLAAMTGAEDEQALASLRETISRADAAGARMVLFAGAARDRVGRPSAVLTTLPRMPFDEGEVASKLSIESVSNAIALWAWTGEFIAECVAQGKMPCIYESYGLPGGVERAGTLTAWDEGRFHKVTNVTPEAAAGLGERYLDAADKALTMTWEHNQDAFERAAELIRTAHDEGHVVRVFSVSHMMPSEIRMPQNPPWLLPGRPDDEVKPGDATIVLEYQRFPWKRTRELAEAGSACVLTSSHKAPAEFTQDPRNVYIDPFWEIYDAAVELAGYDARMMPISCVMQAAVYWQLAELASAN